MPLRIDLSRQNAMETSRRRRPTRSAADELSDDEIVRRVLAGDLSSFELIMRRYNQRLFRISRSILSSDADAEDVVQEAYVRAYEHLDQFEGRARFSTWLTRIAVHEATARRRRQHRTRAEDFSRGDEWHQLMTERDHDGGRVSSMGDLHDILTSAIESLPDDLRTVFMLRVVEGISTGEAAACLSETESNVKVRLHRARALLRAWIDRKIGEDVRRLYQFDGARCDRIVQAVLVRIAGD